MEYLGIPFSVKNTPCLQPDFLPFAPWRTAYLSQARQPFRIAVEGSGTVVHETRIRGGSPADLRYLERTIKLLLWSVGGWRVTLQGDEVLISRLRESFSPHGSRAFDVAMMETVYGRPFCVETAGERFPEPRPAARPIGGHLEGCRIGFDAGGSDRKVSAVVDGRTVYSEEVIWHPKTAADPRYHQREVLCALRTAAAHLPRVDAIGVSTAGIVQGDELMVSALLAAVPPERQQEGRTLYRRAAAAMGNVPLAVANDGDVTEHRTLMLLVGCGAAGAIAGIFKAPIAGLVFTLEVLMIDLTMSSLLPLLISAVTAATVSYIVTGTEAMFKFHLDQAFELERIPFVILLGIFCGLISLYFTRAMNSVEGVFGKLNNPYKKLAFGGVMLSVLIFLFPPLYGEGYDTINLLLNGTSAEEWDTVMNNSMFYGYGNLLLVYLMLIILLKVFASSATNGGGGCGGIFAPSLYLGCIAGFVFSHFSNDFAFSAYLPEKNFALMGMAGVMSGVMHAPLTGVFLIAELTGGYDLFLPLMIVSVSSYLTIIAFEPHSIYSMRLAKKGQLLTHHKDKAVLTLMKMENVVEKDFVVVHPEMDLGELVKAIAASHRNVFPVTDKKTGELLGIVLLDDIRNIMFRQELYHRFTVNKLMISAPAKIFDTDGMEQVMQTFDDTKAWNLPVVDEEGRYQGFVSKSKIFNSYRQVLVHFSED